MARGEATFFRGSELPRLLVLLAVLAGGLVVFWQFGRSRPRPQAPPMVVVEPPRPIETDDSFEFESVTDRTPMTLRDTAAYAMLLRRARGKTPAELARDSRRDILLTHLWERPGRYRGVPIHVDGTAMRALRYESKLSETGWLYEAWIETPETGKFPYVCVFEDPPKGFPIGPNLAERVVFNGYFLKIMKYQAGDVARGAPLLVGRIGWDPAQSTDARQPGSGSTLTWTLVLLALIFVINLGRWLANLFRAAGRRGRPASRAIQPTDQIDPDTLDRWVRNVADEDDAPSTPAVDGGTLPPDESQSKFPPETGG